MTVVASERATAREALSAYGKQTIKQGSKSFALASLLFGREMQADAQMLYAWCRHCDDVIDGQSMGEDAPDAAMTKGERRRRLARLREQTRASLKGEYVGEQAFDAFAEVARRHRMPEQYPFDLLNGFAMDAEEVRFETLNDTLRYCYGVAGVVGIMMAILMGVDRDDEETLDRACDLGLAFQLTNICRDIYDDARAGRVYVPAQILTGEGVPAEPASILDPANKEAVWKAALKLLDIADEYYASATSGVRRLPPRAAAAVAAARNIYRDIGRRIREGGPDVWRGRVAVSGPRKASLALAGLATGAPASIFLRRSQTPPRNALWSRKSIRGAADCS
ncbi:phytoene/squalene synthase family protein [Hyphococcus sp.]|uniref:phytoene/squalene synthase family protein n=1 Tax=Hyphococcus sp. TaxID=2038636 RepID=UPI003D0DED79